MNCFPNQVLGIPDARFMVSVALTGEFSLQLECRISAGRSFVRNLSTADREIHCENRAGGRVLAQERICYGSMRLMRRWKPTGDPGLSAISAQGAGNIVRDSRALPQHGNTSDRSNASRAASCWP